MRPESLRTLLRLRGIARDEARRVLDVAVSRQALAQAAADAAEQEIARETELACNLAADDAAVEAFGAWLAGARQRAAAARDAAERTEAETARARAALTLARAGLEAAEALDSDRAAQEAEATARREQHALDDLTRQRR